MEADLVRVLGGGPPCTACEPRSGSTPSAGLPSLSGAARTAATASRRSAGEARTNDAGRRPRSPIRSGCARRRGDEDEQPASIRGGADEQRVARASGIRPAATVLRAEAGSSFRMMLAPDYGSSKPAKRAAGRMPGRHQADGGAGREDGLRPRVGRRRAGRRRAKKAREEPGVTRVAQNAAASWRPYVKQAGWPGTPPCIDVG